MLHAIIQNKAKVFFSGHARRPKEDIVTSCVFGSLNYLPPSQVAAFLDWVLGQKAATHEVKSAIVKLWPRNAPMQPGDTQREVDVLIDLSDGHANTRLIIEVKWEGGLSQNQAHDQWQYFGPEACEASEATTFCHLFIAKGKEAVLRQLKSESTNVAISIDKAQAWERAWRVLDWHDVAKRLRTEGSPSGASPEAGRLAADVVKLLAELGERPFDGFSGREDVLRAVETVALRGQELEAFQRELERRLIAFVAPCPVAFRPGKDFARHEDYKSEDGWVLSVRPGTA